MVKLYGFLLHIFCLPIIVESIVIDTIDIVISPSSFRGRLSSNFKKKN